VSEPTWKVLCADSRKALRELAADSVDAVVCDPPYDLTAVSRKGSPRTNDPATPYGRHKLQDNGKGSPSGFMGLAWDGTGIAFDPEFWKEVLRVLKPGGHLLSFGGTRTFHRMGCAVEDAGFEPRDAIFCWMHGQGFPKSLDVAKQMGKLEFARRNKEIKDALGKMGHSSVVWSSDHA
jgi:site-specific DNA-methyltransferase (adenine-specific)